MILCARASGCAFALCALLSEGIRGYPRALLGGYPWVSVGICGYPGDVLTTQNTIVLCNLQHFGVWREFQKLVQTLTL